MVMFLLFRCRWKLWKGCVIEVFIIDIGDIIDILVKEDFLGVFVKFEIIKIRIVLN